MTGSGWGNAAGGIGQGMQSFGSTLVQARLLDMQLKNQTAQTQAQIAGNLSLEQMRQRFEEEKKFPHEKEMRKQDQVNRLAEIREQITGQKELATQAFGFDLKKKEFSTEEEKKLMAEKFGFDVKMLEKDAASKGELMDKDYLLKAAVQAGFQKAEHKNAIALAKEQGAINLEHLRTAGKIEDKRARDLMVAKAAMEYAPEPMIDFILADKYGVTLDENGRPVGTREDMARFLQAKQSAKANSVAERLRAAAAVTSPDDEDSQAQLEDLINQIQGADKDSIDTLFRELGVTDEERGARRGQARDKVLDIFRTPEERGGGAETRPGQAGVAESQAASRPSSRPSRVPREPLPLPTPRENPDIGEELGDVGRSNLTGAMNELNFADTKSGLVTKPAGSKFYKLTGQKGVQAGGRDVLEKMNSRKTGEKFIFNPQTGTIREAPPKEAIGSKEALNTAFPGITAAYGEGNAVESFQGFAWDAIKEASGETGMADVIQKVRAEHPEIDVQATSELTEELKVAVLRLRAIDLANDKTFGIFGGADAKYGKAVAEVNRLVQEKKLKGEQKKIPAPRSIKGSK